MNNIKVLIVDDSIMFRTVMARRLSEASGIEVVGTAADAPEADEKIMQLKPDVVTLDVVMPNMSGIEFLKLLMPRHPLPVVMVSSLSGSVFDAIGAGAVDFVAKPSSLDQRNLDFFTSELVTKIKIASIAKQGQKKQRPIQREAAAPARADDLASSLWTPDKVRRRMIAMGASTGGSEAVAQILSALPREMPGIVVVQHMPPHFTRLYAERLNGICKFDVKEAEDGDVILPGRAFIAPGGMQMKVFGKNGSFVLHCREGEKVSGHSPSVDVLFDSVSKTAGKNAIGVLLTGMGKDGANGLLSMKQKGAFTLAQDEKTCVVYGMPREAVRMGAVNKIVPLENIADEIIRRILS